MKWLSVLIMFAYLMAGLKYVLRDLREPAFNRPAYTRSLAGRALVLGGWPIVTFRMSRLHLRFEGWSGARAYLVKEALPIWLAFVGVLTIEALTILYFRSITGWVL